MVLDFKKCDLVNSKEEEIERIVYMNNPKKTNIRGLVQHICNNEDIIMLSTLMSMLFKIRSKSIYVKDKIDKSAEMEQESILMTEEIIWDLYKKSKNSRQIKKFFSENDCIIEKLLLKYYSEKNTNYISEKFFIETIIEQNGQKEILSLNPFMINQILDYQQKPLTTEEQIIMELTNYYIEAQQYYDTPRDLEYVKHLLYNNNETNELCRKTLFMISNVYQESKEKEDRFYGRLVHKLDKMNYKPLNIINYINNDNEMFKEVLEKFINYNINIEEGRLEELEKKPSSIYAKKIYRKNP